MSKLKVNPDCSCEIISCVRLINRIDDFLEYRYRDYTRHEMRDKILSMIDDWTTEIGESDAVVKS